MGRITMTMDGLVLAKVYTSDVGVAWYGVHYITGHWA
jgi:hypothetical protein